MLNNIAMTIETNGIKIGLMNPTKSARAERFAEWMKEHARTLRLSQADLARKTKLTPQTISQLWNAGSVPEPETCRLVAKALLRPEAEALTIAGHYLGNKAVYDDYVSQFEVLISDLPRDAVERLMAMIRAYHETENR